MTLEKAVILDALKSEITRSTGCTDPGAVCLTVARATRELGLRPEKISVTVSPSIYKNGMSVGVPGTGMRGLGIAGALGAAMADCEAGLAMLDFVTPEHVEQAISTIAEGSVTVDYAETPDTLYVKAVVTSGGHRAHAIISGDYDHVVEVSKDGHITCSGEAAVSGKKPAVLKNYPLRDLLDAIEQMTDEDLSFLLDAARVNERAATAGLDSPTNTLGRALLHPAEGLSYPYETIAKAQTMTAAAAEARMSGMQVPVVAISGSGNHGITNFLGVLAVAQTLGSPREKLLKALAISSTVTVVIKEHTMKLSAFCGCSVSAATGVAAGTVYLMGGSYEDMVHAMQSVTGTLAGMICDGAKESCAFKLSSATALAVQFSYLSMQGAYIKEGMGIVGDTIEQTFRNLGQLNNPGMVTADRLMLQMISGNSSSVRN